MPIKRGKDFVPEQSMTSVIKNTCRDYAGITCMLKELIQNSDVWLVPLLKNCHY